MSNVIYKSFGQIFCLVFIFFGCGMSNISKMYQKKRLENRQIVFVNVNVVAMNNNEVEKDQIVIVQDGKIAKIEKNSGFYIPESSLIINCSGKYLMPGLADMHVHLNNENELFLFLAHGVTTVQNMWGYDDWKLSVMGFPDQLKLRDKIKNGKIPGPVIYTAGPILEGEPLTQPFMKKIKKPEDGQKEVTLQKRKGYDFIKVYDNLDKNTYYSIINKAKEQNIPVKGHVPFSVGIDGVLSSGQSSIDHLTGYIDPDAAKLLITEDLIESYAKKTKEANVWNCPTIVIWQKRVPLEKAEEMKKHPGMKYLSGMQKFFLNKSISAMQESITYQEKDYVGKMRELDYKMVNALNAAGAKLLLGTDCGNPFVFPGWSVHEELQYLVNAGLSPYEALLTGTRNAAEHLGKLNEFGTIETGKRADLVLVDGNPLEDIANAGKISGVMTGGVWYPKTELDEMLKKLE